MSRPTGGPPPRTVLAVPEPFATQGVSADEYARFGTYLKAVKVSPPEKCADEKGHEVYIFLSELSAFHARCVQATTAQNTLGKAVTPPVTCTTVVTFDSDLRL